MKHLYVTLLIIAFVSSFVQAKDRNNKARKVVCYYFSSFTSEDHGDGHLAPQDINPNVCTHVNIAFARLRDNKIAISDSIGLIKRITELRKKNPHLTILISIGGYGDGSTKYSQMVRSETNRKVFIHSVVDALKEHDLDGLDFDWEFPGFSDNGGERYLGRPQDKHDFVTTLKELKDAFAPHGYLLTAALTTAKWNIDHAYDIAGVAKHLDFINLMTYDFHGPWSKKTGHNAPLYPTPHDVEGERQLTIQFAVDYFVSNGADVRKLVLGIPLYGYTFQLSDVHNHRVGAPVNKADQGITYRTICKMMKQPQWKQFWDEHAQVPYAVHDSEWLTYDNVKSVQKKLDFVLEHHLGGVMVWKVDGDDFDNHCGGGRFPLMKLMMKAMNHVEVHD